MPNIAIDVRKINDYGIGTYIYNLLANLPEEDGFHYYLFGEKSKKAPTLFNRPDFSFFPDSTPKYSIQELCSVPRFLKEVKADLYHSPHYTLPFRKVCPTVVTIHDIIHLLFPSFLPSKKALLYSHVMMRNAVHNSDKIIAVSECSKRDILRQYPKLASNKVDVIYNGVENVGKPRKRACYSKTGYILYVGSLKPHKNLSTIIKALGILRNRGIKKRLLIVGEGPENYPELIEEIKKNHIEENIKWLRYKTDRELTEIYRNAALFVFPSIYEGFGLPPLEAMSYGIPVLASSSSSLPEVVGKAGVLVDPLSPEDWAEGILRILSDPMDLGKKGIKQAQKFPVKDIALKTKELYKKIL